MRRTISTLIALLTVAAGLLVAAPAANAADPIYGYRNQGTNKCLDDTSAGFRTYSCNGTNPQRWRVTDLGGDNVRLQNVNTGRCMDDSNVQGLRTVDCNAGSYQKWHVVYWADNTRRFQNLATGACLEDSILGLRTPDCDSSTWESWFRV
ncbi:hypothetical protein Ais01nite_08710 [Asanoa ishikariensis]|uniref:Ricin-type beta-trefoil lectin domain-containing protein n=1 Tax=Asanoa ishikariensis TaxID=137265 RepID=A0A1H3TAK9_9ACTN|nr:RICIN domain-containing protein [Asanoa ishikariensis]GIF62836.1 hypothetical protein Ais01nite_08710 [Asanoa ishikariensis]SDZ46765.1 Ricin-type beta-trefoil lectin domain-containing protein [Asanoa ishikariensis]